VSYNKNYTKDLPGAYERLLKASRDVAEASDLERKARELRAEAAALAEAAHEIFVENGQTPVEFDSDAVVKSSPKTRPPTRDTRAVFDTINWTGIAADFFDEAIRKTPPR